MAPKVKYNLKLRQIFDRAYQAESRDLRNALRELLSDPAVKREYGLRVIEQIRENTQIGVDKNKDKFPKYSPAYLKSSVFDIYGKSKSEVNLTLTGEMLSSMDVLINEPMTVTIFFPDTLNNDKAHGHINGIKTKKGKVVRDFFGLPDEQEAALLEETLKDAAGDRLEFLMAEDLATRIANDKT